jgi:hypothetical protein
MAGVILNEWDANLDKYLAGVFIKNNFHRIIILQEEGNFLEPSKFEL